METWWKYLKGFCAFAGAFILLWAFLYGMAILKAKAKVWVNEKEQKAAISAPLPAATPTNREARYTTRSFDRPFSGPPEIPPQHPF